MCEKCFHEGINRFETQIDFEDFERILQEKCTSKQIEILDELDTLEVFSTRLYYKCHNCEEVWIMSIPENAWRGYFLTEREAIKYHKQLASENKVIGIRGCILLIGIIIIVFWLIFG